VEVCEGRFPKQFPFKLDLPGKEEERPCLASCKELSKMHKMELCCCWQVSCQRDSLVMAPSEEDLEEILLLVQFADHDCDTLGAKILKY
jgi:hypothetical protein